MKRTQTRSIGEVMNEFVRVYRFSQKLKEAEALACWDELLGRSLSAYSRNARISRGVLYAEITSSVVRAELMMTRDSLISAINQKIGAELVRKIVLR